MTSPIPYLLNKAAVIEGPRSFLLKPQKIEDAIHRTRILINKLSTFEVNVFELLGMRNLSSFVGEVFAASMILEHPDILKKNPHQDGYPDLLLLDDMGNQELTRMIGVMQDKSPFSPFIPGGFEVKATCGAVPTPAACKKKGLKKPEMGEQRGALLTGYDWKAHHRETNRLFGVCWDFFEGSPAITGVFYRSDLTEEDWGKVVMPTEEGGRTTSVSIMTRNGVKKMYEGWIAVTTEGYYANFFDYFNKGTIFRDLIGNSTNTVKEI